MVVKVHPEILLNTQRLPTEISVDLEKIFKHRYEDIANLEKYLTRNGIQVVKFFLNVSKKEQSERLIERIEDTSKNWKFEEQDVKEREFWSDYQKAYEHAINSTSTVLCPWYIIPADDKKNMRLIVGNILAEKLKSLDMDYPKSDAARQVLLNGLVEKIRSQD